MALCHPSVGMAELTGNDRHGDSSHSENRCMCMLQYMETDRRIDTCAPTGITHRAQLLGALPPASVLAPEEYFGGRAAGDEALDQLRCSAGESDVAPSDSRARTGCEHLLMLAPSSRCMLCLREVENATAVRILQIKAKLRLAINAVLVTPSCDPGSAGSATPITDVKTLFQHPPIRFAAGSEAQASGASRECCFADSAGHRVGSPIDFAYFLSTIRARTLPDRS